MPYNYPMNIAEAAERGKVLLKAIPRDLLVTGLFVIGCSASFGLGILTSRDLNVAKQEGSNVSGAASVELRAPALDTSSAHSGVVASKKGTKYYAPDCPSVQRIS